MTAAAVQLPAEVGGEPVGGGLVRLAVTDEGIAHILLDNPATGNALDGGIGPDLYEAVLRCTAARVRAVLLTGAGANFCTGGNVSVLATLQGTDLGDWLAEVTHRVHGAMQALTQLDAPVVAAVHGHAIGGGLGLALACDVVLAAESASFMVGFTRIALSLDSGVSHSLPRLVGLRKAIELAFTNEPVSGADAAGLGMVTRSVPDAELFAEAYGWVRRLASGPTGSFAAAKRLMRDSHATPLEAQLVREAASMSRLALAADAREGLAALTQRRTPQFTGR